MNKLLYSVEEIFSDSGYLKEQKKEYYNIPLYQRGYKWEPKHVNKLLDDINNFIGDSDKFYCLQNITIVPDAHYFNIVDGQQRLTTLTILLAFLEEKSLVTNKVRFPDNSIRKETNHFLNAIITNTHAGFPSVSWDTFVSDNPQYDHQDIYHIFSVYLAISTWFDLRKEKKPTIVKEFRSKLLKHVKLIVNKVEGSTTEEKIFGNLNSKRIPLDGADLVRAMLITRVAHEEGKREGDIKNIVRVNERRVKIGWELDQINNWWSQEPVKEYFSKFINIVSEEVGVGVKLFDDIKYPINLLYLLFAEKRSEKSLTLELIEQHNNNALGLYKELLKLHYTLQDWFCDRKIYHFLGYLFNQVKKKEINFPIIWKLWTEAKDRSSFITDIKKLIKKSLSADDGVVISFEDQNINWYQDEPDNLVRSLILMDIVHSLKKDQPFLPPSAFVKTNNDIEHIFPQNPQEVKKKKEFVAFLNGISEKRFDVSKFDQKKNSEKYISEMESFIKSHISGYKINSIGNLVLLYSSLNRSISNSTYSVKRARIINFFHEGNFIQPHSFQVFARYFNNRQDENNDYEHWTNHDITANATFISKTLTKFLTEN